MQKIHVNSSNISSIGYDPASNVLEIEFRDGSIYQYEGVPHYIYEGLMSASSHGQYLHQHIKDKYPYRRIR